MIDRLSPGDVCKPTGAPAINVVVLVVIAGAESAQFCRALGENVTFPNFANVSELRKMSDAVWSAG